MRVIDADKLLAAKPFQRIHQGSYFSDGYCQCANDIREVVEEMEKFTVEEADNAALPEIPGSDAEAFGKRLRAARKRQGLSQSKLAEKVGLVQAYISGYEHGLIRPKMDNLQKLSAALNVTAGWLLGDKEE